MFPQNGVLFERICASVLPKYIENCGEYTSDKKIDYT